MVAVCWVAAPALLSVKKPLFPCNFRADVVASARGNMVGLPAEGCFPKAPVDALGLRREPPAEGVRLTAL